MVTNKLALNALTRELDQLFFIADWEGDPAFSHFLPRVYENIDYDYAATFEPGFCQRFNGLMLRAAETVQEVYCTAFPDPHTLDRLLEMTTGEALLFVHHPIDMEVGGRGFLPIAPETLERLKAQGVSIYTCHAPMDCHDEIGTNASIAQAFGIQIEGAFAPYGEGFAGRIGTIVPSDVDQLVERGKEVFGVDRVVIGGTRPDPITRVAVVPGGGDETELFEEAQSLGAQAYITGEWYTRTTPADKPGQAWAEANRAACQNYAESSPMALLGFSHAATEFLVMTTQMTDFFRHKGLPVTCLEQPDWWR
jgi:putative NIF3 family GTP cyclohydrolase 1 type 2